MYSKDDTSAYYFLDGDKVLIKGTYNEEGETWYDMLTGKMEETPEAFDGLTLQQAINAGLTNIDTTAGDTLEDILEEVPILQNPVPTLYTPYLNVKITI